MPLNPQGGKGKDQRSSSKFSLNVAKLKVSVNSEDNSADILTAPRPWTSYYNWVFLNLTS